MYSAYGSPRYLGDDTATASMPGLENILQAAAPVVSSIVNKSDRESAAVIEAQIKNFKSMKSKIPALAWFYDNEITKLKARLSVAKQQAAEETEGIESTRQWRTLGQAGLSVGILAGIAVVGAILVHTAKAARR